MEVFFMAFSIIFNALHCMSDGDFVDQEKFPQEGTELCCVMTLTMR